MDVTTKCPKCGLMLALDTSTSDEFECPQCGQRLTVHTAPKKAKPLKRAAPRKTASSNAPPADHLDDIDWSIPDIPQQIKRRKRRSVDLDPAVVWSILIVSICVVALIVGGVYISQRGGAILTTTSGDRAAMIAFAPDDWETQAFIKIGALNRNRHRNSMPLVNMKPQPTAGETIDELDELMISEGVGRGMVMTTLREAPSVDELRKRGGTLESYNGFEIFKVGARTACRVSNRAIAMADNQATMRRMIDASRGSNRSPPDLPKEFTAFFRIRTRAVKLRAMIPDWMTPFDSLGVSIQLQDDGGASLFLFGDATSETGAKESIPALERVRSNFREQLGSVRPLFRGSIADLEKLSAAMAVNPVVQEGKRVGVRCVVSADLFGKLLQPQISPFVETPPKVAAAPVVNPTLTPAPQPPPKVEPAKSSLPPFTGEVAIRAEQAQEVLSAQFGRQRVVMVVGVGFNHEDQLFEKLNDLLKKSGIGRDDLSYNTIQTGGWVACVFAPIDDLDGLAKRIEFAEVAQISTEQRRIYLTPKKK